MRHHNSVKSLDRNHAGRKALLRTQTISLVLRGHIQTTKAKAKVTQAFAERLIHRAKNNTEATRRYLFTRLNHVESVNRLVNNIAPAALERKGGYTRITKLGFRKGDAAELVLLQLVDAPKESAAKTPASKKAKKTTKAKETVAKAK